MSIFTQAAINCLSPSPGTVVVASPGGFSVLTSQNGIWSSLFVTPIASGATVAQMVCSANLIYLCAGVSDNYGNYSTYSVSGYLPTVGVAPVWSYPFTDPLPDPYIEPRLDSSGTAWFLSHGAIMSTAVATPGDGGGTSLVTGTTAWTVTAISQSGTNFGSAGLSAYVSSQPLIYTETQPEGSTFGFANALGDGTQDISTWIYFSQQAKQGEWYSACNDLNSAVSDMAASYQYVGTSNAAYGLQFVSEANQAAQGIFWGSNWAAACRGWIDVSGGSVLWLVRAPGLTCYSLTPSGTIKIWETPTQTGSSIIFLTGLGAVNGGLCAYKEVHTWTVLTVPAQTVPIPGSPGFYETIPASSRNVVTNSTYYLVFLDGMAGAEYKSLQIYGYGPPINCNFSQVSPAYTYTLPPEPNLNLNQFATDGSQIYLITAGGSMGNVGYGATGANTEAQYRLFAYNASSLALVWSVLLPLSFATPGYNIDYAGAPSILFVGGGYLHLAGAVGTLYDSTVANHLIVQASDGSVVGPMDSINPTSGPYIILPGGQITPNVPVSSTNGQLAIAFGNLVNIYQD